jgi:hypothetical protein
VACYERVPRRDHDANCGASWLRFGYVLDVVSDTYGLGIPRRGFVSAEPLHFTDMERI